MDFLSAEAKRGLWYLTVLDSGGANPTDSELTEFISSPAPTPAAGSILETWVGLVRKSSSMSSLLAPRDAPETWGEAFVRLGWVVNQNGRLVPTRLAHALARGLRQEEGTEGGANVVVFKPDDSFSYARVLVEIAKLEDVMVVDPYLKFEQLNDLARLNCVKRVLVKRPDNERSQAFNALRMGLAVWPQAPQMRTSIELHDRYVVPRTGNVFSLGTSLNGVGLHLTAWTPMSGEPATAVRDVLEAAWDRGEHVAPSPLGQNPEGSEADMR